MYDEAYVLKMLRLFVNRSDPNLLPLIKHVEDAYNNGDIEGAATVWIPRLVEADEKGTLEEVLALTSTIPGLNEINALIRRGVYRGAANDLLSLIEKGEWQPSPQQSELLQRFWYYFAE